MSWAVRCSSTESWIAGPLVGKLVVKCVFVSVVSFRSSLYYPCLNTHAHNIALYQHICTCFSDIVHINEVSLSCYEALRTVHLTESSIGKPLLTQWFIWVRKIP